jgi:UDP-N-acetylmuramate--alanine ligase
VFEKIKNTYFIGIGGIGMSALARYFKSEGKNVSGYDKTPTILTTELQEEGISVHFEDNVGLISPDLLKGQDKTETLIIYTPAIPKDHKEFNFLKQNGYPIKKRSEVLGMISQTGFTIAVAGTHGKTTTSSMIAHILRDAGIECSAFLGGISKNYNTNLILGKGKDKYNVVEADEYDRSFLALFPDIAVITSMDADHLDIYGDAASMTESYRMFASQLKKNGTLIFRKGLPLEDLPVNKSDYSIAGNAKHITDDIRISDHRYHFTYKDDQGKIEGLSSGLPGLHNVENSVAAIAVARQLNIQPEKIKTALSTYTGVKRRFDYQFRNDRHVYIDDYAHHPEELRACISSARELYPGKKLTGIFQPHLFTRTRDFADGFAKSLSLLDSLLLMDIYPARELPIPGITSAMILEKVQLADKKMVLRENVLAELQKRKPEVLLTLGAGDIDQLVSPVREFFQSLN